MKKPKMRRIVWFITISLLFFTSASAIKADYYEDVGKQLRIFNELYKRLVVNYVDQVDPDALIQAGIDGMLNTLDPYTVYLENEEQQGIRTLTDGEYGGIGLRLGVRNDTLTVIAPMEGSPAARAGIQSGDRILQIDTLFTSEMRLTKAASVMRGKPGTHVTLTILRPGFEERLPFALTREVIKVHDLAFVDFIQDEVVYLKQNSFSRNSADEINEAILNLGAENIQGLILDLRDNPGGLLSSALEVADLFVEPGQEVLATRGKNDRVNHIYHSQVSPVIPTTVPMAVLVNQGSASASEIVSGVLQDLDRAVIIGHGTFGKGLVQTVMRLSRDASLKITTAKYYIPSGRLIQKQDYFNHNVIRTITGDDSVFYTQNKRKVYGGGGITPDIVTGQDTLPDQIQALLAGNHFFEFSVEYHNRNEHLEWPFQIDEPIVTDFFEYLDASEFQYKSKSAKLFNRFIASLDSTDLTKNDLRTARNAFESHLTVGDSWREKRETRHWIQKSLTKEMAKMFGGDKARIKAGFNYDSAIQSAMETLQDQPQYLERLGFASESGPENTN